MNFIILGKTKQRVSSISLGTWSFGGANLRGKMSIGWANQEDEDSQQALQTAYDVGINHWDTADVYGNGKAEQIIGSMWNSIPREDIFLATKVGWDMGKYKHWYHPKHMRHQMESSLERLKTDCVDLLYLHHCNFGEQDKYFDDAIETLRRFQNEGKAKFIGLSDWDSYKIMKFIERCQPDVVQPYRNVWDDTYDSSGLKYYIEKNNLGVCFFSPLMHGLLTGKYSKPVTFEEGDFRENVDAFKKRSVVEKMRKNATLLKKRFNNHPHPTMHGVIDTLISDSKNSCVLLGQRNSDQVNTAKSLGITMAEEDMAWVKSLYKH